MQKQGYDHSLGMETVIFSADINPADETVDVIFKEKSGWKVVKDGYYLIILDGHHNHKVFDILCKTGNTRWSFKSSTCTLYCVMVELV